MLRGHPLANRCCICCCNVEYVDHLLLFCPIAHSLWTYMLRLFGINWVMPGLVADLLFCWSHWLGKHSSNIQNLVPGCLMWTIWTERNRRSFEDKGELWFNYQIYANGPSQIGLDVGVSRIVLPLWNSFHLLVFLSGCYCLFVHYRELFVFSCFSLINNIFFLLIKKKMKVIKDSKFQSCIAPTKWRSQ